MLRKDWMRICVSIVMLQVLWCAGGEAQSAALSSQKNSLARYVMRVNLLHQDLRWALAQLWMSLEEAHKVRDAMESKRPKTAEETGQQQTQWNQLKSALLENAGKVRANAKRMRSLTPVPRILKKADDKLIDATLDLERGLEMLETWTRLPADEHQNSAAKQIRRAQTTLDMALKDIMRRTDAGITEKVYVD